MQSKPSITFAILRPEYSTRGTEYVEVLLIRPTVVKQWPYNLKPTSDPSGALIQRHCLNAGPTSADRGLADQRSRHRTHVPLLPAAPPRKSTALHARKGGVWLSQTALGKAGNTSYAALSIIQPTTISNNQRRTG